MQIFGVSQQSSMRMTDIAAGHITGQPGASAFCEICKPSHAQHKSASPTVLLTKSQTCCTVAWPSCSMHFRQRLYIVLTMSLSNSAPSYLHAYKESLSLPNG